MITFVYITSKKVEIISHHKAILQKNYRLRNTISHYGQNIYMWSEYLRMDLLTLEA